LCAIRATKTRQSHMANFLPFLTPRKFRMFRKFERIHPAPTLHRLPERRAALLRPSS
jgi:hypothetical protein